MKEKIIVIAGPTAVGKTALGIKLANHFGGEVISGDSLQVYRHLDIGTAKATPEEQRQARHHLIDIREIDERYSAADFQKEARVLIQELHQQNKLPIIVGGTGLYIQALLYDFELGGETESTDVQLRQMLEQLAEKEGKQAVWHQLQCIDPKASEQIHPNNLKRVIRAIEIKQATGKSVLDQEQVLAEPVYEGKIIGLMSDREKLYERINSRVDQMLAAGILDEAKRVYEAGPVQAAQGIGYKEFFPYFEGKMTLEACIEKVKQHSRQYAKRQLTWFRNRMDVEWWNFVENPESYHQLVQELDEWYHA